MEYYIFRWLVVGALGMLSLWLIIKIVIYLLGIVAPPREIVVVPYSADDAEMKKAAQTLSAKLRRVQSGTSKLPSGYGFLELPALAAVPREAQEKAFDDLKNLKDIQITIKDIEVNKIIAAVQAVLSPPKHELKVRVIKLDDATEVSGDLVYGNKLLDNWHSRARKPDQGGQGNAANPPTSEAGGSVEQLLDDVLFQMTYDLMTEDKFAEWGVRMNRDNYSPQNWQTLQAYTRGVQALTAYQQSLDYRDLKDALKAFERMPIVAPDNPYGLYYYGISLSEDRQEAAAVAVFEQLQRLLASTSASPTTSPTGSPTSSPAESPATSPTTSPAASPTTSPAASPVSSPVSSPATCSPAQGQSPSVRREFADKNLRKMYYEAKFNEATARLKLYRRAPAGQAARTLDELIGELKLEEAHAQPTSDDKSYYRKLLAVSHAQLAYTHGTILSLIREGDKDSTQAEIDKRWVNDILGNIKCAKDELGKDLASYWKYNAQRGGKEQSQAERERKDIEFRIKNSEGYSKFRWAGWYKDDETFRRLCLEALGELEQANLARPNHYEALQNMAMIYEDARFDPDATYLERAESLYLLTTRFVPNDYYQYEHLALIQLRRIEQAGEASTSEDLIKRGRDYANKALTLRPQSSEAFYSLAQFNVKEWKNKNKSDAALLTAALGNFKRALGIRNRSAYRDTYEALLRSATDPATKDQKKARDDGEAWLELAEMENRVERKRLMLEQAITMFTAAVKLTPATNPTDEQKRISEEADARKKKAQDLLNSLPTPGGNTSPPDDSSPPNNSSPPAPPPSREEVSPPTPSPTPA